MLGLRVLRLAATLVFFWAVSAHAQTQPRERHFLASGTPPFVCQPGETFGYFYYGGWRADLPELRASSWCGAADAANAYADKVDTDRSRVPYRTEKCVEGDYWTYSHASPTPTDPNRRWYSSVVRDIWMVCHIGATVITNEAPGALFVSESGPVKVRVTRGGSPLANVRVINEVTAGRLTCPVYTDAEGKLDCTFTAPEQAPQTVKITSTCEACVAPAVANVQIIPKQKEADAPTCRADTPRGLQVGRPILPATGEKRLSQQDYADGSAHPLSVSRTYRSVWSNGGESPFGGSLGTGWVYDGMAVLKLAGTTGATVHLGTTQSDFTQEAGEWRSATGLDRLTPDASGFAFYRALDESTWRFAPDGTLRSLSSRNGLSYVYEYDAGVLRRVRNAFGRSLVFTHDAAGRMTQVQLPDGSLLRYGYDAAGRLVTATHADGTVRTYLYEDARWPAALTGIVDESGRRFATYAYDDKGRGILTELAGGADRHAISYGAAETNSATVTDALNSSRTYVYSRNGGRTTVASASSPVGGPGDAASRQQDSLGLLLSETDFLGVQTMYTWDPQRQLPLSTTAAANKPEAQTVQTQWHPTLRLPVLVTEAGRTTAYTYDEVGNKLTETVTDTQTGESRTWTWTYTAQSLPATLKDPKGGTWQYGYDTAGDRVSVRDPLGRETRYTHDAAGRVLTETLPGGLTTTNTYDVRGRLTRQVRGGETSTYTYLPTGQLQTATLPNGYQVTYSYDAAQRLIVVQDNRGASISYTLDAAGNRIAEEVKDAGGNIALTTRRVIDTLGRVAAIQGAQGQTTQIGYDANGTPVSETDPLNQTTRQTLDGLKRPTATQFADNTSATQAWNPLDQLTQVTDPKGVRTTYATNAFGEVTSETSPDIGTIRYTRDANGQVTQTEDAKGQISRIERDALGRVTSLEYAANHKVFITYDAAGFVTKIEDKSGSTSYTRDAQGRILSKTQRVNDNPSSPSAFQLVYTLTNGELTGVQYPSGLKITYTRQAGRITAIQAQEPGGSTKKPKPQIQLVSSLSYTALGQPKAWGWSNGDAAQRSFDADGRMVSNEFATYGYDAAGRITAITQKLWAEREDKSLYELPLAWSIGYDSRNRLVNFQRSGASTQYSYDANSNRLTAIARTTADTDLDGEFDEADLSKETSQQLNVEASSNRLLGLTQTLSRTKNGQTKVTSTATVNYSIDANGSMTSDGLRNFDYDESGRLAKVRILKDGEAAKIDYLVNGLGQRVFKGEPTAEQTLPNQATLGEDFITWLKKQFSWMFTQAAANTSVGTAYVYGDGELPAWAMLGEYDNGSATGKGRTEYIWLPTEDGSAIPVAMYRNGNLFAIHTDHLGTPRLVTNEARKPVWQWPYSAFGDNKPSGILRATTNPQQAVTPNQPPMLKATAATEMNLRFPGQYFDQETGTAQNYFRDYDAQQGRYRQGDPIGLEGGLSRFVYVEGDALTGLDPLGLANGAAAQMWMKKPPPPACTCSDIMAYQAGIGKDAAGGTEYGHHWLELGASESYGYWPNGSVSLMQTLLGVPGSVNRGRPRDPHHGDHASAQVSFPAQSTIRPSSDNSCKEICDRAKQCIRNFAAGYNDKYGGQWSYRGEIGDNNCHTFQRRALEQCRLQK